MLAAGVLCAAAAAAVGGAVPVGPAGGAAPEMGPHDDPTWLDAGVGDTGALRLRAPHPPRVG